MIKQHLTQLITEARRSAQQDGSIPSIDALSAVEPALDVPKQKSHGDYATNLALILAKPISEALAPQKASSRDIGQILVDHMKLEGTEVERVELAGPGFINFYLRPGWLHEIVRDVVEKQDQYGTHTINSGKRILVEFVSANPNGPITVAHGRGGAIGDALASLLAATGYEVEREFYVNDALNSTQMNNFGRSVHFRYLQELGVDSGPDDEVNGPDWLYRGDYVKDIAREIIGRVGDRYKTVDINLPENVQLFRDLAQEGMQQEQSEDLAAFGIKFDRWYTENALHESGAVKTAIEDLTAKGYTYVQEGAIWLKSTQFGDDKDRVLVRANGLPTYIAGDLAYHKDKFERGFDQLIDVWGADHGGYIARTKAAIACAGFDPKQLHVLLFQLVRIMQNGEMVRASKRRGNVLELKADLIDEIGKDAARFFFLMRSSDTSLDIDIDLAKEHSAKNPVYYVQYAHARCCRILEKAAAEGIIDVSGADLTLLTTPQEIDLMKRLGDFPDEIEYSAATYAPHNITSYLRELSSTFHLFYDAGNNDASLRVIGDDPASTLARLFLVQASRVVLRNALTLLGLSSPVAM